MALWHKHPETPSGQEPGKLIRVRTSCKRDLGSWRACPSRCARSGLCCRRRRGSCCGSLFCLF